MRSFSAVAGVLLVGMCLSLSASAPTFLPARLVVDLNSVPVALDSAPTAACTQGDTAYFQATDANSMVGLWKSDGTSSGTTLVLQMGPAGGQAFIHCLGFSSTGLAYFWGSDTTHGQQLWRSDGTAAGTLMLSGFTARSFATEALLAFLPNGVVIFQVDDQVHGNELWVSDGTAAGTSSSI
jgi:ELWxxDGT repeat protein